VRAAPPQSRNNNAPENDEHRIEPPTGPVCYLYFVEVGQQHDFGLKLSVLMMNSLKIISVVAVLAKTKCLRTDIVLRGWVAILSFMCWHSPFCVF
jgi:hypothetical protein